MGLRMLGGGENATPKNCAARRNPANASRVLLTIDLQGKRLAVSGRRGIHRKIKTMPEWNVSGENTSSREFCLYGSVTCTSSFRNEFHHFDVRHREDEID